MAGQYFVLSSKDREALKRLLARERTRPSNFPSRPETDRGWSEAQDWLAPELYVARVLPEESQSPPSGGDEDNGGYTCIGVPGDYRCVRPDGTMFPATDCSQCGPTGALFYAGGGEGDNDQSSFPPPGRIPALEPPDKPGKAEAQVYRLGPTDYERLVEATDRPVTVYNLSRSEIRGDWVLVARDKYGQWYVIQSGGDSSWWVMLTGRCGRAYSGVEMEPDGNWPIVPWAQCSNPRVFVEASPPRRFVNNIFDVNGSAFNVAGGADPLVVRCWPGGLASAAEILAGQDGAGECPPTIGTDAGGEKTVPYYLVDLGGTSECDDERYKFE